MMTGDVVEEEFGDFLGLAGSGARDEMGVLGKAAENDIDAIVTMVGRGETTYEVHGHKLPVVVGYGERLEFAALSLVGGIDGLASSERADVGFDVGKERGQVEATSSFGVDVEEMVDAGVVRNSVKVTEFGVGNGKVGAGGVAMDEAMLERLGEVDMCHGIKDFLRGLMTGSAKEGIGNTIGLAESMSDGEGKLDEKVQPAGLTRGDILFGEDIGDDGVVGANGEVLAIEGMVRQLGNERGGRGSRWVGPTGGDHWDGVVDAGVADGPMEEVEIEAVEVGVANGPAVEVEVGVGVGRGGRGARLEPDVEVGIVVVTIGMEGVDVCAMLSIRLERPKMEVAKEDWRARMVSCMDCIMVSREMVVAVASVVGCSAVKSRSKLSIDAVSMPLMLMVKEPFAIVEGEAGGEKSSGLVRGHARRKFSRTSRARSPLDVEFMADMQRRLPLLLLVVVVFLFVVFLHVCLSCRPWKQRRKRRASTKRAVLQEERPMAGMKARAILLAAEGGRRPATTEPSRRYDPSMYSHLPSWETPLLPSDEEPEGDELPTFPLASGSTQPLSQTVLVRGATSNERGEYKSLLQQGLGDDDDGGVDLRFGLSSGGAREASRTVITAAHASARGLQQPRREQTGPSTVRGGASVVGGVGSLPAAQQHVSTASLRTSGARSSMLNRTTASPPEGRDEGACRPPTGSGTSVENITRGVSNMRAHSDGGDDNGCGGDDVDDGFREEVEAGDDDNDNAVRPVGKTGGRGIGRSNRGGRGRSVGRGSRGGVTDDGGKSATYWSTDEQMLLVRCKREQEIHIDGLGHDYGRMRTKEWKWVDIAKRMANGGSPKDADDCMKKWDNLFQNYKKIQRFQNASGRPDFFKLSNDERKEHNFKFRMERVLYNEIHSGMLGNHIIFPPNIADTGSPDGVQLPRRGAGGGESVDSEGDGDGCPEERSSARDSDVNACSVAGGGKRKNARQQALESIADVMDRHGELMSLTIESSSKRQHFIEAVRHTRTAVRHTRAGSSGPKSALCGVRRDAEDDVSRTSGDRCRHPSAASMSTRGSAHGTKCDAAAAVGLAQAKGRRHIPKSKKVRSSEASGNVPARGSEGWAAAAEMESDDDFGMEEPQAEATALAVRQSARQRASDHSASKSMLSPAPEAQQARGRDARKDKAAVVVAEGDDDETLERRRQRNLAQDSAALLMTTRLPEKEVVPERHAIEGEAAGAAGGTATLNSAPVATAREEAAAAATAREDARGEKTTDREGGDVGPSRVRKETMSRELIDRALLWVDDKAFWTTREGRRLYNIIHETWAAIIHETVILPKSSTRVARISDPSQLQQAISRAAKVANVALRVQHGWVFKSGNRARGYNLAYQYALESVATDIARAMWYAEDWSNVVSVPICGHTIDLNMDLPLWFADAHIDDRPDDDDMAAYQESTVICIAQAFRAAVQMGAHIDGDFISYDRLCRVADCFRLLLVAAMWIMRMAGDDFRNHYEAFYSVNLLARPTLVASMHRSFDHRRSVVRAAKAVTERLGKANPTFGEHPNYIPQWAPCGITFGQDPSVTGPEDCKRLDWLGLGPPDDDGDDDKKEGA
ncbi:hypothetical protein CBR_g44562 [Chara braunii]|uniref:Myb-like domain-containing protein n=1 Tax=Chara braunii TaxID=69332 RepID=A0A388LXS0_CHABU|nr:hypothetical protein CBR_g44562 [Chara braunii]|eukprot:GBG87106.1 hypothetical protein CBR_g44562 [Chara braunii]